MASFQQGEYAVKLYGWNGTRERELGIDASTRAINIIDYAHHEVHAGSHFFVSGFVDMPLNDVLDFTWVMPNTTKWVHWLWKFDTEAKTHWYIYENAVIVNALANTIVPFNNNRNSAVASATTMKYELHTDLATANIDTNVTAATTLKSGIAGAGKTSGSDMSGNELILKQGATYCLRAIATGAGYIDFYMEWYEHQDKDA